MPSHGTCSVCEQRVELYGGRLIHHLIPRLPDHPKYIPPLCTGSGARPREYETARREKQGNATN